MVERFKGTPPPLVGVGHGLPKEAVLAGRGCRSRVAVAGWPTGRTDGRTAAAAAEKTRTPRRRRRHEGSTAVWVLGLMGREGN